MNPHNDFPEVLHPVNHHNPHFHSSNSYDIKGSDPCFPHQAMDPILDRGSGRSRWSSMSRSRRYWCIAGVILLILIMVGAIAGGIMGSDIARRSASNPHDNSDGDNDSGDPTATDAPPSPTGVLSHPHESSRLAVGYGGNSASNFRLILLQDVDGDLSAIEWRGSKSDHYKIKNRFDTAQPSSDLSKPLDNSPLSMVKYGPDGDLHLFYFNDKKRFSHLVRRASVAPGGKDIWRQGSLSAGDASIPPGFAVSDALRLSATVLPADWTGLDADAIVLMYWTSESESSVAMFSSTDPQTRSAWQSRIFSLGAEHIELEPHSTSSGFLMIAIQRPAQDEEKQETVGGVRLIWDLRDDSEQKTFAVLDCTFVEPNTLRRCKRILPKWTDTEAEKIVSDAPKPLSFSSRNFEANDRPDNSTRYLLRVLDNDGQLTELLWDDGSLAGHESFDVDRDSLPDDDKATELTYVASGDENLLYGISQNGSVMEFASGGSWWVDGQDSRWKFVDYV